MVTERDPLTPTAEIVDIVQTSDLSGVVQRSLESIGVRTDTREDAFKSCLNAFRDDPNILAVGIIPFQTQINPFLNFVLFLNDNVSSAARRLERGNSLKTHLEFAKTLEPAADSCIGLAGPVPEGLWEKYAESYARNYPNSKVSLIRFPEKVSQVS